MRLFNALVVSYLFVCLFLSVASAEPFWPQSLSYSCSSSKYEIVLNIKQVGQYYNLSGIVYSMPERNVFGVIVGRYFNLSNTIRGTLIRADGKKSKVVRGVMKRHSKDGVDYFSITIGGVGFKLKPGALPPKIVRNYYSHRSLD